MYRFRVLGLQRISGRDTTPPAGLGLYISQVSEDPAQQELTNVALNSERERLPSHDQQVRVSLSSVTSHIYIIDKRDRADIQNCLSAPLNSATQ